MSNKLPPLNWLRAFEASARHLNFTLAADELSLTQAAISKQIKNLEYKLGITLFVRLPSGLELTESGAAYLPPVRDAIERLATATDELFSFGGPKILNIHVSLIFFTTWLAPKLPDFYARHPQINLRFTSSIWADDHEMLGEIALEVRYGSGDWPNLTMDRLTWDDLQPVCSPKLIAAKPPLTQPKDLLAHKLLHVAGYQQGWAYWLSQTGHGDLKGESGIQFDSLIAAFEVAVAGFGVALGRSSLTQQYIQEGRLVAPFDQRVSIDEAFYLLCSGQLEESSDAALFRDWLVSTAAAERPNDR